MTENEYWDLVNEVERLNPGEILLKAMLEGHNAVNEAYLAFALKRLPSEEEIVEDEPEIIADEVLRGLWSARTQLFGDMNKLSNKFHECKTDQQRADNSKLILMTWERILEAKARISYYAANGELPHDDREALPDNPVALSKKLASLRSLISQKRSQIKNIAGLDESTPGKQGKIDAAEMDLKQLQHLAGLAEQKLKAHEQA